MKHLLLCVAFVLLSASVAAAGDEPAKPPTPATPAPATTQAADPAKGPAVNKVCPVDDKPVDRDFFVIYKGQKIGFCCEDCIKDFKEDPDRYLAKLNKK